MTGRPGPKPLNGRTLLVVEPRGGTGRTIARAAEAQGARVFLSTPASGKPRDEGTGRRRASQLDSEGGVDGLFDEVTHARLEPDTLIAVLPHRTFGPLGDLSLDAWREGVLDPLRVLFWLCRRALEEFLASEGPRRVVFFLEAPPSGKPHPVLVEALRSLVRSLTREYARRDMWFNAVVECPPHAGRRTEGVPERNVAIESALFLTYEDASFVNGETLRVSGGASNGPPRVAT